MKIRGNFGQFIGHQDGVAAVEFSLIAPVIAAILIGVASVAPMVAANTAMHDAASAGARYVMAGGVDPSAIQSVTMSAWPNHKTTDSVSVSQSCTCAGVQAACTTLCSDGTVPQGYTTINLSSLYTGSLSSQNLSAQQIIRTR